MKTEVEKMYSNAEIKPLCQIPDKYCGVKNVYEDFTAEKQLELIKWLLKNDRRYVFDIVEADTFNEDLARCTNEEWQSLTKEEKQQIKEILE